MFCQNILVKFLTIKVGLLLIRNLMDLPNPVDDNKTVEPKEALRNRENKKNEEESKKESCIKIDNVPLQKLKSIVARKRKGKYRLTANRSTLKKKGKVLS